MNPLMHFINLLGYATTIIYFMIIYNILEFLNVGDFIFTLFWWIVFLNVTTIILSLIANKIEESS